MGLTGYQSEAGGLRPYQSEAVRLLRRHARDRPVYVSPTGTGKGRVGAAIAEMARAKGHRTLIIVPSREILRQFLKNVDAGVFSASRDIDGDVVVASVQTLASRLTRGKRVPDAGLIIADEVHRCRARGFNAVLDHYRDSWLVGMTATPCRLDGRGLGSVFGRIVETITPREAIDQGYLARYTYWSVPSLDVGKLKHSKGEFDMASVEEQMFASRRIFGDVVENYRKRLDGGTALLFAPTIAASIETVRTLNEAGIVAEHVDGKTPRAERDAIFDRLQRRETLIVSNVGIACEGFDCPSLDGVILTRPTESFSLARQQVGRALRPPGPAVILDHVALWMMHGLPDEDVTWTLEDRAKANAPGIKTAASCPVCGYVFTPPPDECPECGYEPTHAEAKGMKPVAVELVEIREKVRLTAEERSAYYETLLAEAHRADYKIGFADARYRSRLGSWYRGSVPKPRLVKAETSRCTAIVACRFCESVRERAQSAWR